MKFIIKNNQTGEYLKDYEYSRYGMAERTACVLMNKARKEGKRLDLMAVDRYNADGTDKLKEVR